MTHLFIIAYILYKTSLVAQTVKRLPTMQETWVQSLGRSPGEGNGNPFQYSCLENPMDGEAWQASTGAQKIAWLQQSGAASRKSRCSWPWLVAGTVFCKHQFYHSSLLIYLLTRANSILPPWKLVFLFSSSPILGS